MGDAQVNSRRSKSMSMMKAHMKEADSPPRPTMVDMAVKTVV